MAVNISDLKKAGVYSGAYKGLFTAPLAKKSTQIRKLEDVISGRIRDTRNNNFADYRTFLAIDIAHEQHFMGTAPMLIQTLAKKNLDAKGVMDSLASWGLSERDLFLNVDVPGQGTKQVLNYPVLFEVLLPVVIAYHTIRLAGIFGERDTSPCFKFVPLQQTDKNKVACNIWEDIVDTIATWYGYSAYKKQAISQMLKYGTMLAFPLEEWHCEKQMHDGVAVVQKEGLRYAMPHPSRMGIDLNHPAPTINSDTGCEWGLHWSVLRYGDILDNRMYWNRRNIMHSNTDWFSPGVSYNFFQELYPCTLRFPQIENRASLKREERAAYSNSTSRDAAVFLTTKFWKLVPRDWGLADYKYPVWHRFDIANDDTIVWAAPCAYNPMWFLGYDYDSAAGQHSSLSLEALQWQYHLTNILTQMVLTAKANLANLIFYDKNLVNKDRIVEIQNLGENRYRGFHFIDFDSLQLSKAAGLDVRSAFHQVQFQNRPIRELQGMIGTTLSLMERMLQFTAQETGSAASHYQSRGEVEITKGSGDVRRNFTASGVDDGFDAWRLQVVTASKAYLNNDITASVSTDIKDFEKHVKALGFEVKDFGDRKVLVAGKKKNLPLETFARSNVGPTQPGDPQTAQAIMSALSIAFQNEATFAEIGPKRIVKLLEQAVVLAGGPRNFDITSEGNEGQSAPTQLLETLKPIFEQLQATILQTVAEKVVKPIAEQTAEEQQRIEALEAIAKQLQQAWQANGIEAEKLKLKAMETQQSMAIEAASAQAEEQRKAEAHQLDMTIKASAAGVKAQIDTERVQTDLALKKEAAAVDSVNKKMVAVAKTDALEVESKAKAEAVKKQAASTPKQPGKTGSP